MATSSIPKICSRGHQLTNFFLLGQCFIDNWYQHPGQCRIRVLSKVRVRKKVKTDRKAHRRDSTGAEGAANAYLEHCLPEWTDTVVSETADWRVHAIAGQSSIKQRGRTRVSKYRGRQKVLAERTWVVPARVNRHLGTRDSTWASACYCGTKLDMNLQSKRCAKYCV